MADGNGKNGNPAQPPNGGNGKTKLATLIEAVVTSFVTIFQTLFYFDLRARRLRASTAAPVPDAWE